MKWKLKNLCGSHNQDEARAVASAFGNLKKRGRKRHSPKLQRAIVKKRTYEQSSGPGSVSWIGALTQTCYL